MACRSSPVAPYGHLVSGSPGADLTLPSTLIPLKSRTFWNVRIGHTRERLRPFEPIDRHGLIVPTVSCFWSARSLLNRPKTLSFHQPQDPLFTTSDPFSGKHPSDASPPVGSAVFVEDSLIFSLSTLRARSLAIAVPRAPGRGPARRGLHPSSHPMTINISAAASTS